MYALVMIVDVPNCSFVYRLRVKKARVRQTSFNSLAKSLARADASPPSIWWLGLQSWSVPPLFYAKSKMITHILQRVVVDDKARAGDKYWVEVDKVLKSIRESSNKDQIRTIR